jgi:hypothetical protein
MAASRVAHQEWLLPAGITDDVGETLGDGFPGIGIEAPLPLMVGGRQPFQQVHVGFLAQGIANWARSPRCRGA